MSTSNKVWTNHKLARRLRAVESRNITFASDVFPIFWESARGSEVWDVAGKKYLDLTSAFAVSSLGHGALAIRRAIVSQSRKMWHGMGDVHPNAVKVELLEALAKIAPGNLNVSILSSSGSEAVESALKTARLYTGKPGVIVFSGAYHGLSYGTLALTDRMEFYAPFRDQIAATVAHMPFPDSLRGPTEEECLSRLDQFLSGPSPRAPLAAALSLKGRGEFNKTSPRPPQGGEGGGEGGKFGAILFEPVQGRGGIRVAGPKFVKGLREISRRYGLLLIADEIMTGLGRTGRLFAVEHAHVVPDLMCVGKALANGFPLSACVGRPEVMAAWPPSDGEAIHTSTFLGNPLGCAMALASLRELQSKKLASRSGRLGAEWLQDLREALGAHPRVGDIRGLGLMLGIELVKDKKSLAPDPVWTSRMVSETLKRGLVVLSGGAARNVLTLTPPLTISKEQIRRATKVLRSAFYGTTSI